MAEHRVSIDIAVPPARVLALWMDHDPKFRTIAESG
jgi:hypothetical protein